MSTPEGNSLQWSDVELELGGGYPHFIEPVSNAADPEDWWVHPRIPGGEGRIMLVVDPAFHWTGPKKPKPTHQRRQWTPGALGRRRRLIAERQRRYAEEANKAGERTGEHSGHAPAPP